MPDNHDEQLLHMVFGGELIHLGDTAFKDLNQIDVAGIFPDYSTALAVWKSKAQQSVDNAHMRYFIVPLHRLLHPGEK